jgi:hypothetical protein
MLYAVLFTRFLDYQILGPVAAINRSEDDAQDPDPPGKCPLQRPVGQNQHRG